LSYACLKGFEFNQSVSQSIQSSESVKSVENSAYKKFLNKKKFINFEEGFMDDLKTFLGLAGLGLGFEVIFRGKKSQAFLISLYSTTV